MHTLKLCHITKFFEKKNSPILNNYSYSFKSNKTYAIVGPSGIGKSTLLAIMAGIEPANQGTIHFDDTYIVGKNRANDAAKIGLIFQNPQLITELTVFENVMLHAIINNEISAYHQDNAYHLLEKIGLAEKANSFINTLSGGQQQRVAIARAMLMPPQFLLADEPTGSLDSVTALSVFALLLQLHKEYNMGLIVSTHDPKIAQMCDEIIQIANANLEIAQL